MPRPSKKAERSEEIIYAYERCVITYGVEGATLQRVADEAGLARPLLHHYVGNREDLLDSLIERWVSRTEANNESFTQFLPNTDRCRAYIEMLFDPRYASNTQEILLYQALMVAAQQRPALKKQLVSWYESFIKEIKLELQSEYNKASKESVTEVATGIIALYFNADSMAQLVGAESIFPDSKQAALRLLETL